MKKIVSFKKTKLFWLYFIAAVIFIAGFVFLAPFWGGVDVPWKDWGSNIIYVIMGIFLTLYLAFYLFRQICKRKLMVVYTMQIVEFVLLAIIDVFCFISPFVQLLPDFFTVCRLFGFALFLRGLVGCFHGYFYDAYGEKGKTKYPLWQFCVDIVLLSFGVFFMSTNVIEDIFILWVFVSILLLLGVLCVVVGILCKPSKEPKTQEQIEKEKEEEKEKQALKEEKKAKKEEEKKAKLEKKEAEKEEKQEKKAEKKKAKKEDK